ncbi:MAG: hypothetical protein MRJ68_16060 [Nitrospira sp.]|nr:hypothetical protein [Nitrospira sp.]
MGWTEWDAHRRHAGTAAAVGGGLKIISQWEHGTTVTLSISGSECS